MVGVAGIASSFAQNVYSVNVVGYINLTLTTEFSLIANQLDDGAGNYVTNIMAGVPNNTIVYKFNGVSYVTLTWRGAPFNAWSPALQTGMTMAPGEGVFVKKPVGVAEINLTCVGEVLQGDLSQPVVAGFEIYSAMVPQEGGIQSVHNYIPTANDIVYKFNGVSYVSKTYRGAPFNAWTPAPEPVLTVGEAVFIKAAAAKNWDRTFNVE
jgi:hypothetical protein